MGPDGSMRRPAAPRTRKRPKEPSHRLAHVSTEQARPPRSSPGVRPPQQPCGHRGGGSRDPVRRFLAGPVSVPPPPSRKRNDKRLQPLAPMGLSTKFGGPPAELSTNPRCRGQAV